MTEGGPNISDLMTKNKQRYWRRLLSGGLIVAVVLGLVVAVVLGLVVAASLLLTGGPDSDGPKTPAAPGISLEEWLAGSLSPKGFNGMWITGNEILYRDEAGNLVIYNVTSKEPRIILNASNAALSASFDHQISADRKYLLLAFDYQKLYRHTYLAYYRIVNLRTLTDVSLTANDSMLLQLATWAPRGNALVYVYQNNIYYRPEVGATDYQITNTGVFGTIYNGVPDWVYEEEVFGSNKALWFSPSGTKLAFGYFDDTLTPSITIPVYGYPGSITFQYTSAISIHYPKSGRKNPTVKLFYVDLEKVVQGNANLTEIEHPAELNSQERILSAVAFPTDNLVYATWMNRVQNTAYFHFCYVDGLAPNCTVMLKYFEEHGWVEQFEPPVFTEDGNSFLTILPQKQANGSYWKHVTAITNVTSNRPSTVPLTSGHFVVTDIVGLDQANSNLYYLATTEADYAVQHLYRISVHGKDHKPTCLSCDVVRELDREQKCLYNTAKFSTDHSNYVLTCAGPGVPDITIYNRNSKKLSVWENNEAVSEIVAEKSQPLVRRFEVPVPGGFKARVRLLIPPDADLSGATKYPMLIYVYGGPDTYQVTQKFNIDWGTYLVTSKSIIYANIDGRGSGLMDNGMLFAGYRKLGTVEIADQINVTRYLQDTLPYIDRTRTAIWGWSYGGYATGMTLAMDYRGVFKCGISVAPVTDWTLYDSIYTERFMGLPSGEDNFDGYEQSQLLNKVDNIKTKMYYLIHGTLDDNVHYQQSLLLAKVLEQKDILFRQQTYTDEDHGIVRSRAHLYHSLENFLDDCFEAS